MSTGVAVVTGRAVGFLGGGADTQFWNANTSLVALIDRRAADQSVAVGTRTKAIADTSIAEIVIVTRCVEWVRSGCANTGLTGNAGLAFSGERADHVISSTLSQDTAIVDLASVGIIATTTVIHGNGGDLVKQWVAWLRLANKVSTRSRFRELDWIIDFNAIHTLSIQVAGIKGGFIIVVGHIGAA